MSHVQGGNMAKTLYFYFILYLGNKVFSCILSHATQSVLFSTTCCLLYKIYFIQIIFTFFINHVLTFKYWPCRIKVSKHLECSLFCSLSLLRMINRILLLSKLWDCSAMKRQRIMGGHSARVSSLSWNSYILSSGSRSGHIIHHDVRQGDHLVAELSSHTQEVRKCCSSQCTVFSFVAVRRTSYEIILLSATH